MKLAPKQLITLIVGLSLFFGVTSAFAQLKIRYINTDRILQEYPEAQEIQKKSDELRAAYETEFQKMQSELQTLVKEIQDQALLLSPEKKAEKEAKAANLQAEMERYYYEKLGPQGEYFKENKKLTTPLIEKINSVIRKIGEEEGYDYILDVVQGVILHAKEEYDLTDRVLEELNKTQ